MEMIWMVLGFSLAAYSVVANDAIQTLGTFLSSNSNRPWWVLWLFTGSILLFALGMGWWAGDISYGKLARYPLPEPMSWVYVIPPLVLLGLTRWGMPVSTTFLVLTVFNQKNLYDMIVKSGLGYLVAFATGFVVYLLISRLVEHRDPDDTYEPPGYWVALQWLSTAWLWYNWLVQDLANIYVFLPRGISAGSFAFSVIIMLAMLAWTLSRGGGTIQKIVTSKTGTSDVRSASVINVLFGIILLIFKEWSRIPMSTTWVFLGLLAGRELAKVLRSAERYQKMLSTPENILRALVESLPLPADGRGGANVAARLRIGDLPEVAVSLEGERLPTGFGLPADSGRRGGVRRRSYDEEVFARAPRLEVPVHVFLDFVQGKVTPETLTEEVPGFARRNAGVALAQIQRHLGTSGVPRPPALV